MTNFNSLEADVALLEAEAAEIHPILNVQQLM